MESLSVDLLASIFSFMQIKHLALQERVCKLWSQILNNSFTNNIYRKINLRNSSVQVPLTWVANKINAHSTYCLSLSGTRYNTQEVATLLKEHSNTLLHLNLSFYNFKKLYKSIEVNSLPNVHQITVCEAKLSDSALSIILTLPKLTKIDVSHNHLLEGNAFKQHNKPLTKLWFEGCENFTFENALHACKVSAESLQKLGIDGENFSTQQVCSLVSILNQLNNFSIPFADWMENQLLSDLKGLSLEFLKIKKAYMLEEPSLVDFFSCDLSSLAYLELSECNHLSTSVCIQISRTCFNLKTLILCWCLNIFDQGIRSLVTQCKSLNYVDLTGLKFITDSALPLDEGIYTHLRFLSLCQCNEVSDKHLWEIHYSFPRVQIMNYYGEYCENWKPYNSCF